MEFPVGVILIIFGLLMILTGLIGHRVGTEPRCRRCRFELSGLRDPGRCPECGRDITDSRAISRGRRSVRKRLLIRGAVTLLFGGLFIGVDTMNRTGFLNLTAIKPAGLLYAEASLLDDSGASRATIEIETRGMNGTLRPGWRERLVSLARRRHAQTWRAFPNAQWTVLTRAMGRGELNFEQVKRIFNDCFASVSLLDAEVNETPPYPEEKTTIRSEIRWRAGTLSAGLNLGDVGFAYDLNSRVILNNPNGPDIELGSSSSRGGIIQRFRGTPRGSYGREHANVTISAPTKPGTYNAVYELEVIPFQSSCSQWAGMTPSLLSQMKTLKKTYRIPFVLHVAEEGSLDPEAITLSDSTVETEDVLTITPRTIYRDAKGMPEGIIYVVHLNKKIPEGTGVAGHLVFEQGTHTARAPMTLDPEHNGLNQYTLLPGFVTGPISVRYEYDPAIARRSRSRMHRVVNETLKLNDIIVPNSALSDPPLGQE